MTTYLFEIEVEREEDGRWSAWVEALPGCATWGHTREEALAALRDATQAYIEVLIEQGKNIPQAIETRDSPVVAVTV